MLSAAAALITVTERLGWATDDKKEIPRRKLGRTGQSVSMIGLGGYHLGKPDEQESIRIVRTAIDKIGRAHV